MATTEETYRHAAVVKTTVDDPTSGREKGATLITEGKCEDGVAYTVVANGSLLDIECEVLEVFEADQPMSRQNINDWAAQKVNESDIDYSEL